MTTCELLSESVEAALQREDDALGGHVEATGGRTVLYGAGRLGRKVAAALRRRNLGPLAFADNNPRLAGTSVDGVPVMPLAAAAERFRHEALFAATIFLPTGGGMAARLGELAELGCDRATSFLPLAWKNDGVLPHFGADLPSRLLAHSAELKEVAGFWCDELSRETFRGALSWRLRAEFEGEPPPEPNQYFPGDILRPDPQEYLVDGGAFDGDTLRAAPWPLARILAVEPDPASAARLRSQGARALRVHEALLGSAPGLARFNAAGTVASSRSDSGQLEVPVMTLDELTEGERPTYIKLDVEGDELEALRGGRGTLERSQPVVAVCLYHRPEDLWTIPLFVKEVLPGHRMYLRAHAWDGFELVLYAIPPDRCLKPQ